MSCPLPPFVQYLHGHAEFPDLLFARKKSGLLEKLAGELDAGQIAEVRLGIEDGLTEGSALKNFLSAPLPLP